MEQQYYVAIYYLLFVNLKGTVNHFGNEYI